MRNYRIFIVIALAYLLVGMVNAQNSSSTPALPQFEEWSDDFEGATLDEQKWERFTFEGAGGGKLEIKKGEIQIRSGNGTRAGIRTKNSFTGERWMVEAQIAKVGAGVPTPGSRDLPLGFANLTILFDGTGRNRVEWILNSDGGFEAWSVVDGRGERLDNRRLGTKMRNPILSIGRRGDEFLFILNSAEGKPEDAQIGLQTKIRNLPKSFHVMLYGFGSSENNWNRVRVVVPKNDKN